MDPRLSFVPVFALRHRERNPEGSGGFQPPHKADRIDAGFSPRKDALRRAPDLRVAPIQPTSSVKTTAFAAANQEIERYTFQLFRYDIAKRWAIQFLATEGVSAAPIL
jgi:hypothetical protein